VTGRIRDIGQNVLQSSVQTVSSNSHSYCNIIFLIAFLEWAFIRNVIIPCINYKITIHINNNETAVINNNLLESKFLYCSSNLSGAAKIFVRNL